MTTLNPNANQSLPSAYDGQASAPANRGGLQINQALLDYLEAGTQDITYLMAVPSAMQGSDYVIATGGPQSSAPHDDSSPDTSGMRLTLYDCGD